MKPKSNSTLQATTFSQFHDKSSKEHFIKLQKIGEGKFSVYQIHSLTQKTNYALKIFPKTPYGAQQYKNELLSISLHHPNIIRPIPFKYLFTDFYALVTEYAEFGDFLSFITTRGPLKSDILIRTYFRQLIEGLEYIHSQGLAHLDLKLENIVLGDDFKLKIIDFDQAQPITQSKLHSAGTPNSRAPEIIEERCQNLAAADVYSTGVILFSLKSGQFPFIEINKGKQLCFYHYSLFTKNNSKFWMDKAAFLDEGDHFDNEFVELMNGMLEYDPQKRLTIQQIKESKWYNESVLCEESLRVEMKALWDCQTKNIY